MKQQLSGFKKVGSATAVRTRFHNYTMRHGDPDSRILGQISF